MRHLGLPDPPPEVAQALRSWAEERDMGGRGGHPGRGARAAVPCPHRRRRAGRSRSRRIHRRHLRLGRQLRPRWRRRRLRRRLRCVVELLCFRGAFAEVVSHATAAPFATQRASGLRSTEERGAGGAVAGVGALPDLPRGTPGSGAGAWAHPVFGTNRSRRCQTRRCGGPFRGRRCRGKVRIMVADLCDYSANGADVVAGLHDRLRLRGGPRGAGARAVARGEVAELRGPVAALALAAADVAAGAGLDVRAAAPGDEAAGEGGAGPRAMGRGPDDEFRGPQLQRWRWRRRMR
mmetsp:Transcript_91051/g.294003  ORF Transcript_91051/g.294003 Transcript_91051/m.294003 type:complete len:292 (-) Transcript_91051:630-1505(-)